MVSKHTPGPWELCGGYTPAYSAITSNDGYIVFGMADASNHTEHGRPIKAPGVETQRANARLIAAAPELLNMLKVCAKIVTADGYTIGDEAAALIAKAEGRA